MQRRAVERGAKGSARGIPSITTRSRRSADSVSPSFVVVTGLSGSGKSQVQKCFEDLGFFCIDNLPLQLVPEWGRLTKGRAELKTALIVDVRERGFLGEFDRVYGELEKIGVKPHLLFLEADDAILLRRFSETRRPHPLARKGELLSRTIARERAMLQSIRSHANDVINTSQHTVHQLRKHIFEKFGKRPRCLITILSFGFRAGIPPESDIVIDVRMLPNPHFTPRLRERTGLNRSVIRFMRSFTETRRMLDKTLDYLRFLIPLYVEEGKSYLTISFGCTGGKHRSVFMAEEAGRALIRDGLDVTVSHRDITAG